MKTKDIFERSDSSGLFSVPVNQSLNPGYNRFRMDVVKYLEERNYGIVYDEPQALWTNSCPLGNGDMGALVYGAPEALHFVLGKTDLWDYREFGEGLHPAVSIERLREIILNKDHKALREATEKQRLQSYKKPVITGKPGGMLRIELFGPSLPARYRQRLSIAKAECTVTWTPFGYAPPVRYEPDEWTHTATVKSFIHASANVLAVRMSQDMATGWGNGVRFSFWRDADPAAAPSVVRDEGGLKYIYQELPGGEHFVLMADVSDGRVELHDSLGRLEGSFLPGKKETELYLTLVTSRESKNPARQAKENIESAKATGWENMRTGHRKWWQGYWERGYVATPFETLEKCWYYALYLQASICRPGRMSPGLQGNWIKENYPAWNADFHNNINMQVLYGALHCQPPGTW